MLISLLVYGFLILIPFNKNMDFAPSSSSCELTENKDSPFIWVINTVYCFPSYADMVCVPSMCFKHSIVLWFI